MLNANANVDADAQLVVIIRYQNNLLVPSAMLIDRSKIKPSELSELGSNCHIDAAYEEADLDAGVCAQVEETVRKRCKLKEKLQRNLQNIQEDIR